MESATLNRRERPARLPDIGLGAVLLLVAAASWGLADARMGGMDAGPGSELGSLPWFLLAWLPMMAAMMLPSAAPVVVAQARLQRLRRGYGSLHATGLTIPFVAGYLAVWVAAGLLGYLIVEGGYWLDAKFFAWERAGRYLAGGVLLGAAIYELTPFKDVWLRRCRSPRRPRVWPSGPLGALRMGIEHGRVCVGCCWGLMAALFALGVMSTGWMAVIAVLIAAEKLAPGRLPASRGVALVLTVLAIAVAAAPERVPGLTIPGSPAGGQGMDRMSVAPIGAPARGTLSTPHAASAGARPERAKSRI